MNNKRLVELIKNPGTASEKEISEIKNLSKDYAYSSFLKVLQARIDNLHNHKNKSKSLTRAAVYIADRSVLKTFISNDKLTPLKDEAHAPAAKDIPAEVTAPVPVRGKEREKEKESIEVPEPIKEERRSVEAAESKEERAAAESGEVTMSDSTSTKKPKKRRGDIETVRKGKGTAGIKEEKGLPDATKEEEVEVEAKLTGEVEGADKEEGKVAIMEKDATIVEDEKEITGKEQVADVEDEKEITGEKEIATVEDEKEITGEEEIAEVEDEKAITGKEEVAEIEDEKAITGEKEIAEVKDEKILTEEDKAEEIEEKEVLSKKVKPEEIKEGKVLAEEEEVDLKETEIAGADKDKEKIAAESDEKSSLSSEVLKNITELKKHKASLFHFLETGEKKKHKPEKEKSKKSAKKLKDKKKNKKEEDKEESKAGMKHTEQEDTIKDVSDLEGELEDYPGYEEEDPEVIKNFLKKLEKSNPPPKRKLKKEEQKKLIEKFIQSDPQMQSVRSSKEIIEKKDLSLPSVKFRDDIISENLAGILVKQGKHEKAIDIYKKLIWKFPQKKAYFATQIEALKKKSGK